MTVTTLIDSLVAVLVPVSVVLLAVLSGRISWIERFFVSASLRRARRLVLKKYGHDRAGRAAVRTLTAAVADCVHMRIAGFPGLASDIVNPLLLDRGRDRGIRSPQVRDEAALLWNILRLAAAPGRQSAVARLAWTDSLRASRRCYDELLTYVERTFINVTADTTGGDRTFSDLVSRYSGAFILADGHRSRSGVIDDVQVVTRSGWDGPEEPHPEVRQDAAPRVPATSEGLPARKFTRPDNDYSRRHRSRDATMLTGSVKADGSSGLRPGDYDGRIFSLRAVDLGSDTEEGTLTVRLETVDSCYTVSENAAGHRCKHLPSTQGPAETPVFDPVPGAPDRLERPAGDRRTVLLNTITFLISYSDGEPTLILSRRTGRANNALDVISATTGGVFENRRGDNAVDADTLGTPSPLVSAAREAREELGLDLDTTDFGAQCVFLANVQGRPRNGNRDNGQLVGTVCFLVNTELTLTEINHHRALHSDWSTGRFEMSELVDLRFPSPATGAAAVRDSDRERAAREFIDELEGRFDEIDQNSVIGAVYAASHIYGREAVEQALRDRLHADSTWWGRPWSGDSSGADRLVRPLEVLYGRSAGRILGTAGTDTRT